MTKILKKRKVIFISPEAEKKLYTEQTRRKKTAPKGFKDVKISEIIEIIIHRTLR